MMKLKLWVALAAMGAFALCAIDASAVKIHVAKSYPAWDKANNGKANQLAVGVNPDLPGTDASIYEFGVNSLIEFNAMMRFNKDGANFGIEFVPASGSHEIIFEDSAVYDCAAEVKAAKTAGAQHNIAWAENDNWHGGVKVKFDVLVKAATDAKPVLSMTGLEADSGAWGRMCFFGGWNYDGTNKPTGPNWTFDGITFEVKSASQETHVVDVQSDKAKHPVFKNCVFDWQADVDMIRYPDNGAAQMVDPGVVEFQHCAFRAKDRNGSLVNVHNGSKNWDYILDFANCTFVNIGTNDVRMVDGHSTWDDGSGKAQGEGSTFTKCLFYNFSAATRWDFKARLAVTDCVVWNPLNKGAWAPKSANGFNYPSTPGDVTKMTGNLAAPGTMTVDTGYGDFGFAGSTKIIDPVMKDVNAAAFYLLTENSPAAHGGGNNVGFDQGTLPVELSTFSAE